MNSSVNRGIDSEMSEIGSDLDTAEDGGNNRHPQLLAIGYAHTFLTQHSGLVQLSFRQKAHYSLSDSFFLFQDASQKGRLLRQREETLEYTPPPTRCSQRRRCRPKSKTAIQSSVLGFRALRSQKMLRKKTDALWTDAGAFSRAEVSRGGHIVGIWSSFLGDSVFADDEAKSQCKECGISCR